MMASDLLEPPATAFVLRRPNRDAGHSSGAEAIVKAANCFADHA